MNVEFRDSQRRDLNSDCITRHMHYKRPQQCSPISVFFMHNKRKNKRHSYAYKKVLALFQSRLYKQTGWEILSCVCAQAFCPSNTTFLCIGTLKDDIFLGWVGIVQYLSLDGFYSASVSFLNYLGLWSLHAFIY